ncbi:MAG: hypothetical protein CL916_06620 [Deltaproteobacteria bacterium]|nr:hypothetical protein [Deltaproteobacteria bacterium]
MSSTEYSIWNWEQPQQDIPYILAVSIGVLLILGLSEFVKRKGVSQEWSRKTAHIGSGALAIPFPWMFKSVWPIIILCSSFFLIMMISKSMNFFQGVHGVKRKSHGAFVFPLVIILVFCLAQEPLHYAIPIAVLSLSDAMAALIGKRYGQHQCHTLGETRSMEGSTAFFFPTFLLVHIPLLLLTDTGRTECVLMGFGCAILVTAFEMISVRGLDNVFIPFGTWYVLDNYADYLPDELAYRIGFMFVLFIFFLTTLRYHIFTRTGAVGGFLVIYGMFSMGWDGFFIPALGLFGPLLAAVLFKHTFGKDKPPPMGVSHTFQSTIVAMLVLFAFDNTKQSWLLYPFITACSAGTIIVVLRLIGNRSPYRIPIIIAMSVFAPLIALYTETHHIKDPTHLLIAWGGTLSAVALYSYSYRFQAIFICPQCQAQTLERRHCGVDTHVLSGHPFFTQARIGLVSIFCATVCCSLWVSQYA